MAHINIQPELNYLLDYTVAQLEAAYVMPNPDDSFDPWADLGGNRTHRAAISAELARRAHNG